MKPETTIRHILFDLGNVLVEIHPEKTTAALAQHCQLDPRLVQQFFLSEPHLEFMAGKISARNFYEIFQGTFRCSLSLITFNETWNQLIGSPKPGIANIVMALSRRYTLSVCSNTDPLHWEVALQKCSFLSAFRHYFLSYQLGCIKPSRQIFEAAFLKLNAKPAECLFIDDTPENVQTADALGMATICAHTTADIIRGLSKYEVMEQI